MKPGPKRGLSQQTARGPWPAAPGLVAASVLAAGLAGCGGGRASIGTTVDGAPGSVARVQLAPGAATTASTAEAVSTASSPAPSPEPVQPRLHRLTEPGCCTLPSWAPDNAHVLYIDRPTDAPAGIWSVSTTDEDPVPEQVADEVAYYDDSMTYRMDVGGDVTTLTRLTDGHVLTIPAGGRPVSLSPDGTRVAWSEANQDLPPEERTVKVRVAKVDGSDARDVASLPSGSLSGWAGNDTLLLRARNRVGGDVEALSILDIDTGTRTELASAPRLRGEAAAPGGDWVAYYVAGVDDPAATGVWVVSTHGGAPRRLDKSIFGAYRWRDDGHLLVVPLPATPSPYWLLEVDAATLAVRQLTDPERTPFKIANGDFAVSPDGRHVVFVEAADKAIWVVDLPK